MLLPYQRGRLHDLPDDPLAYDAVLAAVVEEALARLTPEGNLEHPAAREDIGDTSLGLTSLLTLARQRTGDPRLPDDLHVFAVRYGPGGPCTPAGDTHAEPEAQIRPR